VIEDYLVSLKALRRWLIGSYYDVKARGIFQLNQNRARKIASNHSRKNGLDSVIMRGRKESKQMNLSHFGS
jgi:hypothetical protein